MRILAVLLGLTCACAAPAADFKPYPGSRVDKAATQAASQDAAQSPLPAREMVITINLSNASFEKVPAFCPGLACSFLAFPSRNRAS
ncbi:MAG: hypothetical protein AB1424_04260 [Thermodesulfobacteriota bacterium]